MSSLKKIYRYPLSIIYTLINLSWLLPANTANGVVLCLVLLSIGKINGRLLTIFFICSVLILASSMRGMFYSDDIDTISLVRLILVFLVMYVIFTSYTGTGYDQLQRDSAVVVLLGGFFSITALINYYSTHMLNVDLSEVLFGISLQKYSFRLLGWHANPNNNAFYVGSAFIFMLGLDRTNRATIHYVCTSLVLLLILASGSRGAILGVFFISLFSLLNFRIKNVLITILFLYLIVSVANVIEIQVLQKLISRLSIGDSSGLAQSQFRGMIWAEHWAELSKSFSNLLFGFGLPGYLDKVTDGSFFRLIGLFGLPIGTFLFLYSCGLLSNIKRFTSDFKISFSLFMIPNLFFNDWVMTKSFGLLFAYFIVREKCRKKVPEVDQLPPKSYRDDLLR